MKIKNIFKTLSIISLTIHFFIFLIYILPLPWTKPVRREVAKWVMYIWIKDSLFLGQLHRDLDHQGNGD